MNTNRLGICIFLALVALLSSCIDEIEQAEVPANIASEHIVFGGVTTDDIIITRSGEAPAPKITEKVLKSESGNVSLPLFVKVEQGINPAGPVTRAAITTEIDDITQLDAWATKNTYSDTDKTQVVSRELFFEGEDEDATSGALFTKAADNIFYPDGNGPYLWEKSASSISEFQFVTVSPANSGFKAVINPTTLTVTFDYEVPAAAADQRDVLVAVPEPVAVNYGQSVPLDYKHVMAAVNVKVGTQMPEGVIKSIKFTGVYDKGSYYPSSNEWTNRTINTERENGGVFSVSLPEGGLAVGPESAGTSITSTETSFMMIPQQLFTGSEIEVVFYDNMSYKEHTLRASIQGDIWDMNTTTNYWINIDGSYNLQIVPVDKVLDSHYIITRVEVSSDYPIWQLKAKASDGAEVSVQLEQDVNPMARQGFWTDKVASKDANGNYYIANNAASARGGSFCMGAQTNSQIIYVFIPENVSGTTRHITLELTGSDGTEEEGKEPKKTIVLEQEPVQWMQDPNNPESYWGCELILEGGQVPWGFCFEDLREEWRVAGKGGGTNQPPGWITKITAAMRAAGLDVDRLYQDDSPIRITDEHKSTFLIYIDYGMLGNINVADDYNNGSQNTLDLYYFEGINVISSIKAFLVAAGDEIEHVPGSFTGEIESTLDYAAMYAMKRNRFHFYETNIEGTIMQLPVIEEKDINWYLPAKDQFPYFMNLDWGQEFSFNDLFWTSTAYLSETEINNAHAYAYINGVETISHRNDPYLTFALRRYTQTGDIEIGDDNIIVPGGGEDGPEYGEGGTGDDNEGGNIGGGV